VVENKEVNKIKPTYVPTIQDRQNGIHIKCVDKKYSDRNILKCAYDGSEAEWKSTSRM